MTDPAQEPTIEWLQETCVKLLNQAAALDSPDHTACAKYADLLFKMLPRKERRGSASDLVEQVRAAAREAKPS